MTRNILLAMALLVIFCHALALRNFLVLDARHAANGRAGAFGDTVIPDTINYRAILSAWHSSVDYAPPAFRERVLVPLIMSASNMIFEDPRSMAWLTLPLHGFTALAVGLLARRLSGRNQAAYIGVIVYGLCPAPFIFGPEQATDLLHAQLVIIATALTLRWRDQRTWWSLYVSVVAWMLCQLCRPSFFYIFPVLIVFALPALKERRWCVFLRQGLVIAFASLLVPGFWALSNWIHYGIGTPSLQMIELIHRCVLPSAKMMERHAAEPSLSLTPLWDYYREVEARESRPYVALRIYDPGPVPAEFSDNYRQVMREARQFIYSKPAYVARAFMIELVRQLQSHPAPKGATPWLKENYISIFYRVLFLTAICGTAIVSARREWSILAGVLFLMALVVLPGALSWWGGHRFRLPLDLFFLVLASVTFSFRAGWLFIAASILAGYVPLVLWGAPTAWPLIVALAGCAIVYRSLRMQMAVPLNADRSA